ncbi:MAG: cellulase family glycosylhydrolase [Candidatus Moranbacteria bacterium]|nr:cellulase family glycosylhydrolase [Candidatus Moranbacteria bacterium]
MKHFLKVSIIIMSGVGILLGLLFWYLNLPGPQPREDVHLGMTFSSRYASDLGLDWRETYEALLDDMKIKKMRIPVYWDLVERTPGQYDFSDVDWQVAEAEQRGVEIILTLGQRVPRWPECHIPSWAKNDEVIRQAALLRFMTATVERYKDAKTLRMWQVENEPFLVFFGECPPLDSDFLDWEVSLVRTLDPTRPVLLTDSGELSIWIRAAKRGDVFGTTLYRHIWSKNTGGYFTYPIGPNFFRLKELMVRVLTSQKNFIVIELQAEPWASGWIATVPLAEQFRTMDETKLRENVEYAKRVGFSDIYLWGGEWWYWMKTKKEYPALWETGKMIFQDNAKEESR